MNDEYIDCSKLKSITITLNADCDIPKDFIEYFKKLKLIRIDSEVTEVIKGQKIDD